METLDKGTTVTIITRGHELTGTVISAVNWGTPEQPDWYVEMTCTSPARFAGYIYWKQSIDGGSIQVQE